MSTETYPQIVSERTTSEDAKVILDLELKTKPGTTTRVVNQVNKQKFITVKGFRTGKIPKWAMEKAIGKQPLYQETMVEQYNLARKNNGYYQSSNPDLVEWSEEADGSLKFKIKVEILPPFDISESDYLGIEVESPEINDAKGEELYENYVVGLERQFGSYRPVDRGVKEADSVVLTLKTSVDDLPVPELTFESKQMRLESNLLGKELVEALLGSLADQEYSKNVAFSEEFPVVDVKGKTAQVTYLLESIKELSPHVRNDDLAKATNTGAKTLEELHNSFLEEYRKNQTEINSINFEGACLEKIMQNVLIIVPQPMTTAEAQSMLRHRYELFQRMGLPVENAFNSIDYNLLNEQAKRRVAMGIIFDKVLRKGLLDLKTISDEEVLELAKKKAAEEEKPEETVKKWLKEKSTIELLRTELLYDKFVKQVVENAKPVRVQAKEEVLAEQVVPIENDCSTNE